MNFRHFQRALYNWHARHHHRLVKILRIKLRNLNSLRGEHVVDFTRPPLAGASIFAITGPTGAGKSTLLSLLKRFYDVESGRILIDGTDVRDLNLSDVRRLMGIVFQESFLFSNTVAANIAFGDPEATQERIEEAARIASADSFICELPDGYQSMVGEHGSNLSGGQRQRLSLARAMLTNPSVLLLDDATASVDPETEHEIREAMVSAMRGRTTIIVSNRLSTLRQTDRIVVLRNGVIEAVGTHDELLRTSDYYRELSDLQSSHELEQKELAQNDETSGSQAMTIQMTGANRVSGRRMTRVV